MTAMERGLGVHVHVVNGEARMYQEIEPDRCEWAWCKALPGNVGVVSRVDHEAGTITVTCSADVVPVPGWEGRVRL